MATKKTAEEKAAAKAAKEAEKAAAAAGDAAKKERKPRVNKGPLGTLIFKATNYVKGETAAIKKAAALDKQFKAMVATLTAWGKLPDGDLTAVSILAAAEKLRSDGFVPPVGRVVVESFKEGDLVQLKPDFVGAFSTVYSKDEIESMSYNFYDDISKRAQCHTNGRMMIVKMSQIEPRGTVHAAPVAAETVAAA